MNKRVKIYVEGGGGQNKLKRECRRAFAKFFEKAGFTGRMPRVVAGGSRNDTYGDFCTAVAMAVKNELPLLLVDSEAEVAAEYCRDGTFEPWRYLKVQDGWRRPDNTEDEQAHLMVQCMEAWFLADRQSLEGFFGQNFHVNRLPQTEDIEKIAKDRLLASLKEASRQTQKGEYGKGAHSFKILERLAPANVFAQSSWAARLRNILEDNL